MRGCVARALGVVVAAGAMPLYAAVFQEDFSDTSDWAVSFDPGGGSSVSSDGALGHFYVDAPNSFAVFIPPVSMSTLTEFDPTRAGGYIFSIDVDSVTWSASYMISLDLFDVATNYLGTTWNVVSQTAQTGSYSVNLGQFGYGLNTHFITPKVYVFTGDGGQTVSFDSMGVVMIPEPSVFLLMSGGFAALGYMRHRRHATRKA